MIKLTDYFQKLAYDHINIRIWYKSPGIEDPTDLIHWYIHEIITDERGDLIGILVKEDYHDDSYLEFIKWSDIEMFAVTDFDQEEDDEENES
jgi:hypothetical protein